MKRAVLFGNGEVKEKDFHRAQLRCDDFLIAVDGGGHHCERLGIVPHVAIGDFDSLDEALLCRYRNEGVECVEFPKEKDYIDLVLGIEEALKRGCEEILVLGALGGRRIDMELGNILVLSRYKSRITIKNESSEIVIVDAQRPLCLEDKVGQYFSLLPLSEKVVTGASSGLKYQLKDLLFYLGETRSLSNEIIEPLARVQVVTGTALAVCQKK